MSESCVIGDDGKIIIPESIKRRLNLHNGSYVNLQVMGDSLLITNNDGEDECMSENKEEITKLLTKLTPVHTSFRENAKTIRGVVIDSDKDYEEMIQRRSG